MVQKFITYVFIGPQVTFVIEMFFSASAIVMIYLA